MKLTCKILFDRMNRIDSASCSSCLFSGFAFRDKLIIKGTFVISLSLRSSLEGWLMVKIRHGDTLPVIGRIDLNKKMPVPDATIIHG